METKPKKKGFISRVKKGIEKFNKEREKANEINYKKRLNYQERKIKELEKLNQIEKLNAQRRQYSSMHRPKGSSNDFLSGLTSPSYDFGFSGGSFGSSPSSSFEFDIFGAGGSGERRPKARHKVKHRTKRRKKKGARKGKKVIILNY